MNLLSELTIEWSACSLVFGICFWTRSSESECVIDSNGCKSPTERHEWLKNAPNCKISRSQHFTSFRFCCFSFFCFSFSFLFQNCNRIVTQNWMDYFIVVSLFWWFKFIFSGISSSFSGKSIHIAQAMHIKLNEHYWKTSVVNRQLKQSNYDTISTQSILDMVFNLQIYLIWKWHLLSCIESERK